MQSFDDNGQELWGYLFEESIYEGPSIGNEDVEEEDNELVPIDEEDELDSMSDPYVELPTLDEPSVAVVVAPPVRAVNVGERKGKKVQKVQKAPLAEATVDDSGELPVKLSGNEVYLPF